MSYLVRSLSWKELPNGLKSAEVEYREQNLKIKLVNSSYVQVRHIVGSTESQLRGSAIQVGYICTSRRTFYCFFGLWQFWRRITHITNPTCSFKGCTCSGAHGAHVQFRGVGTKSFNGQTWYIIPACRGHNKPKSRAKMVVNKHIIAVQDKTDFPRRVNSVFKYDIGDDETYDGSHCAKFCGGSKGCDTY